MLSFLPYSIFSPKVDIIICSAVQLWSFSNFPTHYINIVHPKKSFYGADFEENILVKDLDVIDGGQRGWADEPGVEILRSLPRLTLFNFWKGGILVDLA